MSVRLEGLKCPNCGSHFAPKNGVRLRTYQCENCHHQVDTGGPEPVDRGPLDPSRNIPWSALRLGMKGRVQGIAVEIVGRMRFAAEDWFWDEWMLLGEHGEVLWLAEDEGQFSVIQAFVPSRPVGPKQVISGILNLDGTAAKIRERGRARLAYVEGELNWRAEIGQTVSYIDAAGPQNTRYTLEWDTSEIQFFRGRLLDTAQVYKLFGAEQAPPPPPAADEGADDGPLRGRLIRAGLTGLAGLAVFGFTALAVSGSGSLVLNQRVDTAQLIAAEKTLGPFELKARRGAVRIAIEAAPFADSWVNVRAGVARVSGADSGEVFETRAEFWDEHGVEDGESWHESDLSHSAHFRTAKAGTYTLTLEAEAAPESPNRRPLWIHVRVADGALTTYPFIALAVLLGIATGVVALIYALRFGEADDDDD